MNILIGIISYILGFVSCILFVRILVIKKKNDKIINKAKQIVAKEKQKQKFGKKYNLIMINNNKKNNSAKDNLDE